MMNDPNNPKPLEPKWYVLRTYTSHEAKVKATIESEVKRLELGDRVIEVIIPQETVFEVRGGKRKTKIKNFLPGYILVHCILDKKVYDVLSNLPSGVSFVGRRNEATPLRPHEVARIIGRVEEIKETQYPSSYYFFYRNDKTKENKIY